MGCGLPYVALGDVLQGVEDDWPDHNQQAIWSSRLSTSWAKEALTVMLYLNNGGAHVGGEASHGAVMRQRLPRDRSGGPLNQGEGGAQGRRRRSFCWEEALENHAGLIATCRRRESSGFNGGRWAFDGLEGFGFGGGKGRGRGLRLGGRQRERVAGCLRPRPGQV